MGNNVLKNVEKVRIDGMTQVRMVREQLAVMDKLAPNPDDVKGVSRIFLDPTVGHAVENFDKILDHGAVTKDAAIRFGKVIKSYLEGVPPSRMMDIIPYAVDCVAFLMTGTGMNIRSSPATAETLDGMTEALERYGRYVGATGKPYNKQLLGDLLGKSSKRVLLMSGTFADEMSMIEAWEKASALARAMRGSDGDHVFVL